MKRYFGVLLLSALPVLAADDISGTWKIDGDVSGNPVNHVCTIKQTENHLTGSCKMQDKSYDVTGEVDGKKFSFKHGGEYQGSALTMKYSGTVNENGMLKGTIDVDPFNVSGDFTAKKTE